MSCNYKIYDPSDYPICQRCVDKQFTDELIFDYFECEICHYYHVILKDQPLNNLCKKCAVKHWKCRVCKEPLRKYTEYDMEILEKDFELLHDKLFEELISSSKTDNGNITKKIDELNDIYYHNRNIMTRTQ